MQKQKYMNFKFQVFLLRFFIFFLIVNFFYYKVMYQITLFGTQDKMSQNGEGFQNAGISLFEEKHISIEILYLFLESLFFIFFLKYFTR